MAANAQAQQTITNDIYIFNTPLQPNLAPVEVTFVADVIITGIANGSTLANTIVVTNVNTGIFYTYSNIFEDVTGGDASFPYTDDIPPRQPDGPAAGESLFSSSY